MNSDKIFEYLEIQNADDSFKARILKDVMSTADLRFARVVDEVMTDEERQEFEQFAEGKEPEDIARWVENKYEGIGEIYESILESVITDLKRNSA